MNLHKKYTQMLALLLIVLLSACGGKEDEKPIDAYTAEELYLDAQESLVNRNWLDAVDKLQTLEAQFPYGKYAQQAQIDIAYAYYEAGEPDLTIAAADRYIALNPTSEYVDYAYYLKGLAGFSEDKSWFGTLLGRDDMSDRDAVFIRQSRDAFMELVEKFPDSQYAADARARISNLTDSLANHDMVVANYYYSQEAYLAAANRGFDIVEKYPSSRLVEPALALTMFAYENMGLPELASDSRQVLEYNFPDSDFLKISAKEARFSNWLSEQREEIALNDDAAQESSESWFSGITDRFKQLIGQDE